MSDDVLKTLLYPFETGELAEPPERANVLFMNAQRSAGFDDVFGKTAVEFQQHDKALAAALGNDVCPVLNRKYEVPFDMVLVLASRQHDEMLYQLISALSLLREGGVIVAAAANDAGGKRLGKDLKTLGLKVAELSKHKCRVVFATKTPDYSAEIAAKWQEQGVMQLLPGENIKTQPGIFSWNRPDTGTLELLSVLKGGFKGAGADFGCGNGRIGMHLLAENPEISQFYALDSDYRAVQACEMNLKCVLDETGYGAQVSVYWDDLTSPSHKMPPLDWIVMNPPFHTGKETLPALGKAFIKTAFDALRKGGHLWMVANTHLPYENMLGELFSSTEQVKQSKGFKIIHARK